MKINRMLIVSVCCGSVFGMTELVTATPPYYSNHTFGWVMSDGDFLNSASLNIGFVPFTVVNQGVVVNRVSAFGECDLKVTQFNSSGALVWPNIGTPTFFTISPGANNHDDASANCSISFEPDNFVSVKSNPNESSFGNSQLKMSLSTIEGQSYHPFRGFIEGNETEMSYKLGGVFLPNNAFPPNGGGIVKVKGELSVFNELGDDSDPGVPAAKMGTIQVRVTQGGVDTTNRLYVSWLGTSVSIHGTGIGLESTTNGRFSTRIEWDFPIEPNAEVSINCLCETTSINELFDFDDDDRFTIRDINIYNCELGKLDPFENSPWSCDPRIDLSGDGELE